MTRERDIERVLDAWFEPGPTEMPDRLFDDILAQVDRVPQRRALPNLRFLPMDSRVRWLALAAAALVVVVGGLALINRPDANVGATPSPSPTAVPNELVGRWMGGPREVAGASPSEGATLSFEPTVFAISPAGNGNRLSMHSTPAEIGDGTLQLTGRDGSFPCAPGDVGTYTWSLSTSGRVLTLAAEADACAERGTAFAGTWWRMGCPTSGDFCLGDLDPGRYATQFLDPFVTGDSWKARFAVLSYTVPEGWANTEDWPGWFTLNRKASGDASIYVINEAVIVSEATPCEEVPDPTVGRTAQAMADWLANAPGLNTSGPTAVTIGGLSGFRVDASVDPSWTMTCPFSEGHPVRPIFTDADPAPDGLHWNANSGGNRFYLLDRGDDRALVLSLEAAEQANFDTFIDEATAIVESFTFTR